MEGWRCFAGIIDDEVVDVIVVYYVGNVPSLRLSLTSVLLLHKSVRTCQAVIAAHRFATLLKPVLLVLLTKACVIITLFSHRVISELRLSLHKLVIFVSWVLLVLGRSAAHKRLLRRRLRLDFEIVFKVALRNFQDFFVGLDL